MSTPHARPPSAQRKAPTRRKKPAQKTDTADGPELSEHADELLARLTPRQQHIVAVIQESVSTRGYPPSVREIGEAVGLASPSSVSYQLASLQKKGALRKTPHRPRAVDVRTLADDGSSRTYAPDAASPSSDFGHPLPAPRFVPLVGQIAAGQPVLATEMVEDIFPLPKQLTGEGDVFLLKVVGDSMVEAAICDGDWVAVRQQPTANNGDIVAALIDDEATVKRFNETPSMPGLCRETRLTPRFSPMTSQSLDGSSASCVASKRSALGERPGGLVPTERADMLSEKRKVKAPENTWTQCPSTDRQVFDCGSPWHRAVASDEAAALPYRPGHCRVATSRHRRHIPCRVAVLTRSVGRPRMAEAHRLPTTQAEAAHVAEASLAAPVPASATLRHRNRCRRLNERDSQHQIPLWHFA